MTRNKCFVHKRVSGSTDEFWLQEPDLLSGDLTPAPAGAEATRSQACEWDLLSDITALLKIDDLRSTYCEQLESRIFQQAREIERLQNLLGDKR